MGLRSNFLVSERLVPPPNFVRVACIIFIMGIVEIIPELRFVVFWKVWMLLRFRNFVAVKVIQIPRIILPHEFSIVRAVGVGKEGCVSSHQGAPLAVHSQGWERAVSSQNHGTRPRSMYPKPRWPRWVRRSMKSSDPSTGFSLGDGSSSNSSSRMRIY